MPTQIPPSLFLTGFMGAGKSTVGPALARALELPFVDLDGEIEHSAQQSIPQIFASYGEAHFRRLETSVLTMLCAGPAAVVALGGGTLLSAENRAQVRKAGRLIYLKASLEVIWTRMDKQKRPLLHGKPEPDAAVQALFAAREPGYRSAEICISTDGQSVAAIVGAILKEISPCVA